MVKRKTKQRKEKSDSAVRRKRDPKRHRLSAKKVRDPSLKSVYDQRVSFSANQAKLAAAVADGSLLPSLLQRQRGGESRKKKPRLQTVHSWDARVLRALEKKHARDFGAMSRNTKVNTHQWTARQLEKKFAALDGGLVQSTATEDASAFGEARRAVLSPQAKADAVWKNKKKYYHQKGKVVGRNGWCV